jgi:hypothetical protein
VSIVGIHQRVGYPGSLQLRRGFDSDRSLAGAHGASDEDRGYEGDHPPSTSLAPYSPNVVEKRRVLGNSYAAECIDRLTKPLLWQSSPFSGIEAGTTREGANGYASR